MFNLALLIDNHDEDNGLNKKVILDSKLAKKVIVRNNGKDAINYLTTNPDIPDIIFLDINMPIVDGCVFIHEFESLPEIIKDLSRIYILSGAQNDMHLQNLVEGNEIEGVVSKPLTSEVCEKIKQ
ncbi:response regulator [Reichenbachiella sp. MALMAid0571]|uniref:response regulator n=1 Tax=Reichenbachiella sp. MALMAid0571 TaxID=3143939 RepID=UPI0032DF4529